MIEELVMVNFVKGQRGGEVVNVTIANRKGSVMSTMKKMVTGDGTRQQAFIGFGHWI